MLGIGQYDRVDRRHVRTREDQLLYMGYKYRRDKKTGYYICTSEKTGRKRLHVAMWEQKWGIDVPPGCVIHHLDWNKNNNTIENLICLTVAEHETIHNKLGGDEGRAYGYELIKTRTAAGLPPGVSVSE